MTPEQLKASILQYAIQGKLVEQRPEEGTGEELYQQIQAERQRLIQEKKIKKGKPLAEISEDEIPFDIPESWKWTRLGNIFNLIMGQSPDGKSVSESPDGMEFHQGKVYFGEDYIGKSPQTTNAPQKIAEPNSVLLCVRAPVGIVNITNRKLCIGRGLCDVVPLGGMNEKFTLNWLRCFKNAFIKKATGTTFVAITGDTVKNQVVPLPPLAEQKRIVAKIEELLLLVDRYAVAYEKLEQFNAKFPEDMKKSILQYAIQGKLVEQRTEEGTGEELYQQIQVYKKNLIKDGRLKKTRALEPISEAAIPFDFPQPWKVCYIDDIAFVTKLAGFEYTKYIADNLVADGIPLFKGKNVQNGKLVLSFESYIPKSISDELPRSQIAKKCLLTPYVGTIGNIAIFDGSFKAHLGSNVGKIELLNSDIQTFVLEKYVLWYLKSTYGYAELTKHKKATAQESISIDAIRNVIIAIPPLEEQYRIVAKIEELLPLCDRLRK